MALKALPPKPPTLAEIRRRQQEQWKNWKPPRDTRSPHQRMLDEIFYIRPLPCLPTGYPSPLDLPAPDTSKYVDHRIAQLSFEVSSDRPCFAGWKSSKSYHIAAYEPGRLVTSCGMIVFADSLLTDAPRLSHKEPTVRTPCSVCVTRLTAFIKRYFPGIKSFKCRKAESNKADSRDFSDEYFQRLGSYYGQEQQEEFQLLRDPAPVKRRRRR